MVVDISLIFNGVYSLFTLFLIITISSFVVIPGLTVFITSYGSFATSIKSMIILILIVWIASIIGDLSTYFVARRFAKPVEKFLKRFKWYEKNEKSSRIKLQKNEFLLVFLSRFFVSGTGPVINYISGFEKLNRKKFVTAVIFGEFIYSIMYILLGYIFKDTWKELVNSIQYSLIAVVLIAIAVYIAYRIVNSELKEK